MPKINTETTFRIVTVGDPQVGKSNLVTRFSTNTFTNQYLSTIGVEFEKVSKQIENSTINTLIWDTSGQERFRSISSKYYQSAVGVIFVYDITSIESFQNIKNWLEHVAYYSQEDPLFMLIGNKLDLAKESRAVSTKEAVEYAENNNMFHFETSALDSIGVEDAFMSLISHIYNDGPKANNKKKPKDLASAHKIIGELILSNKELEGRISDLEPYKKKCEGQEAEIIRLKQEIEKLKKKDDHLNTIMQMLQSNGISDKSSLAMASTARNIKDSADPENDICYDEE